MPAFMPLVSVITPTHNRADLLPQAMESVLEQSYPHLELIIVDNRSIDRTRELVEAFRDPRIRYFYQENSGSPVSPRNKGMANARGELLCFRDSDDLWLPEKLALQVEQFNGHPDVGLVYADCYVIDGAERIGGRYSEYHRPYEGDVLQHLLWNNFIPAVTVAIKRAMIEKFGLENDAYRIAHDLDLYLKIANSYRVAYLDQPLAKLRIHGVSLTRNRVISRLEFLDVVRSWCLGEDNNRIPKGIRKRIWAYRCFLAGLDLLGRRGSQYGFGRQWIKEAPKHGPWRVLYLTAFFLSFAPSGVAERVVEAAKRHWSVDRILLER